MKKHTWCSLYISTALVLASACGGTTEKGGDHVPTDKTYNISELPKGTDYRKIVPSEYDSELLARFVHVAETYRVCLAREQFSDADLLNFQSFLSNNTSAVNQYGLEGLINYSFATLQAFDSEKDRFSSRVSIQLIWNDTGSCDVVVASAEQTGFPFNDSDFSDKKRVLFGAGQLVAPNRSSTKVPVGYFIRTSTQNDAIHIQKLIASFLGFADAIGETSYLSKSADAATAKSWNIVNGSNQILVGDDSLRIYTFAAAWQDIFKPRDLDRFHYYGDAFVKGNAATDSLLTIGSVGTVPAFLDLPGNRYLVGARKLQGPVAICFENDSGFAVSKELVTTWTSFTSASDPEGVHGKLKALDPAFVSDGVVAEAGCQLFISFRNESQYPFAANKANGFYAHEGSVKASDGSVTNLPVLYVNASNLSLTEKPSASEAARHVSTVIQHEYAHFFGV